MPTKIANSQFYHALVFFFIALKLEGDKQFTVSLLYVSIMCVASFGIEKPFDLHPKSHTSAGGGSAASVMDVQAHMGVKTVFPDATLLFSVKHTSLWLCEHCLYF